MKNRLFYPAVFHKAEEGGFWVSFPDFPECMTQGDSMDEAYEMAIDALGLSLSSIEDEGTDIPKASEFETVDPEDGMCSTPRSPPTTAAGSTRAAAPSTAFPAVWI